MRSRIVYLSVALAAFAVYADTVITDKPDGVNTRTRVVDDNGYVQSERITLAHVPEKYVGEPTGEIPEWANEGGTPITRYFIREGERYVVDDIDYILVSPSSWQELTNAVERLRDIAAERWRMEHETAKGRAMWHGKETNRVVTAQGITWLYRDGYTHFEAAEKVPRDRPRKTQKTAPGQHAPPPRPSLPPRLAEKREAMKSRAGRVREVNAVFGPGGKVLKVEGNKGEVK